MSELFPVPGNHPFSEPAVVTRQHLRLDREEARSRWRARAAEWRALELARALFGPEASVRLSLCGPGRPFRGLLHLEVPFRSLADHRIRESVFLACAGEDPVVARVPFVFIFEPRTVLV